MSRMRERRDSRAPSWRTAGRITSLIVLLAALSGCATSGGGGGLVPTRADRPAATGESKPAAQNPVSPIANDPATAGSDEVPVPPVTPVPEPGQLIGSTASGGEIRQRATAAAEVDSGPSADARDVLATIPEPLPPGDRVSPSQRVQSLYPLRDATPGSGAWASTALVDSAAPADSATRAPGDSASVAAGSVPIPEPTLPLGQRRPQMIPTIPDSVVRAAADSARTEPPQAPSSSSAPRSVPEAVEPDSCWRVQVAAPEEEERAEHLRGTAESLLLVPMVVELERGLYKVRTRDCMNGESAGRLRERAETTGFQGAFRFMRKP